MVITAISSVSAQANQALSTYYSSLYGYCDAKKIAAVWQTSIDNAKVVIGNKILGNLQHLADADIASARHVGCNWDETELTFEDALKLAHYWDRSPDSAKQKAAQIASRKGTKGMLTDLWSVIRR